MALPLARPSRGRHDPMNPRKSNTLLIVMILYALYTLVPLVWLLFRTVSLPPDNPAMPSRHLARIVYLLLGAAGASFGVLMGWLLGRALRSG